jgi:hypothetical protein
LDGHFHAQAALFGQRQRHACAFVTVEERRQSVRRFRSAGKTPAATLYAAVAREIKIKGKDACFTKTDRGHFVHQTPKAS